MYQAPLPHFTLPYGPLASVPSRVSYVADPDLGLNLSEDLNVDPDPNLDSSNPSLWYL